MREYILITGASSGIGLEMAHQFAARGENLILIARSTEKLAALQLELTQKFQIEVKYFPFDLSEQNAARDVYKTLTEQQIGIKGLINNAGFGLYGALTETELRKEEEMLAVNCAALFGLTKLFAQDMVKNGAGTIVNVASILSYFYLPYYSVYSASKAFVLAFSESLQMELKDSGVKILAVCPGIVETPFHSDEMRKTRVMKSGQGMYPDAVARQIIQHYFKGTGVKVIGKRNRLITLLPVFTPKSLLNRIKLNLVSLKN